MDPHILLAQLNTLLSRTPSFGEYSPESSVHLAWLGQVHALVSRWNPAEASAFKLASDFLGGFASTRGSNVARILGTLHRAIADLELRLPTNGAQAFGPGAQYDFFKALNAVVSSAQQSLFVIDPYIDDEIFDTYLSAVPSGVSVKLLVEKYSAKVQPAAQKFIAQYKTSLEVRRSKSFHDRVIFIDGNECWVLGQSIAHAAATKQTYLAPLPPEIAALKLTHYENTWLLATAI